VMFLMMIIRSPAALWSSDSYRSPLFDKDMCHMCTPHAHPVTISYGLPHQALNGAGLGGGPGRGGGGDRGRAHLPLGERWPAPSHPLDLGGPALRRWCERQLHGGDGPGCGCWLRQREHAGHPDGYSPSWIAGIGTALEVGTKTCHPCRWSELPY
jgi:hypothetical protein